MITFNIENLTSIIDDNNIDFDKNNIYIIPKSLYQTLLEHQKNNTLPLKNMMLLIKQLTELFALFKDITKPVIIGKKEWNRIFNRDNYKAVQALLFNSDKDNRTTDIEYIVPVKVEESYYQVGSYSKSFIAKKSLLEAKEGYVLLIDTNKKQIDKFTIINEQNIELNETTKYTLNYYKLDIKKAIQAEIEHYNKYKNKTIFLRINKIFNFNFNKERKITRSRSGRIFTPFTSMSKVVTKTLDLFNIDLSNSQPLMLVIYAIKNNLILDEDYINDCLNGNIYNRFYHLFEQDKDGNVLSESEIRAITKEEFFKCIYYDYKPKSKINIEFIRLYPLTAEILKNHRREDIFYKNINDNLHFSLANGLQNEESFFLTLTTKYSKYVFTKHDAIFFSNKKDIKVIVRQIEKIGKKYNLVLPITIEDPNGNKITETNTSIEKTISNDTIIDSKENVLETKEEDTEVIISKEDYIELLESEDYWIVIKNRKEIKAKKDFIFDKLLKSQESSKKKIKEIIINILQS